MTDRLTLDWVCKYANTYQKASYQDKLSRLFAEKNPYYLIEWLLIPADSYELEQLASGRSPGLSRNRFLPFPEVFFGQLLYELLFHQSLKQPLPNALLKSSLFDLFLKWGAEFHTAVDKLIVHLQAAEKANKVFQIALQDKLKMIESQHESNYSAIVHGQFSDEESAIRLKELSLSTERKAAEAPHKLLAQQFEQHPLVLYSYVYGWTDWPTHLEPIIAILLEARQQPIELKIMEDKSYAQLEFLLYEQSDHSNYSEAFWTWLTAYSSKSGLNRSLDAIEQAQYWYLGALEHFLMQGKEDILMQSVACLFSMDGIERRLIVNETIPAIFYTIVQAALKYDGWRRWLADWVILQNWSLFAQSFTSPTYSFSDVAWVLVLEPSAMEQRLLRTEKLDHTFIVERCTQIFDDGLKLGIPAHLLISIYQYFANHQKDLLVSLVFRMKTILQFNQLLQIDELVLKSLFTGSHARAKSLRKAGSAIFKQMLAEESKQTSSNPSVEMIRLGYLLRDDRVEIVAQWLESIPMSDNGKFMWPQKEALLLAECLQFNWIGILNDGQSEHEWIVEQLKNRSEAILFDRDIPYSASGQLIYRIVRPGMQDKLTDLIGIRIRIVAELVNVQEIFDVLDDLKSL